MSSVENCELYSDLISAYVDGELTDEDSARLQAHLNQCESCRALLSMMLSIHDTAPELEQEPPKELLSRVMSSVSAEKKNKSGGLSRFKFTIAAAVVALVVYAVGGPLDSLFPQTPEENANTSAVTESAASPANVSPSSLAPAQSATPSAKTADMAMYNSRSVSSDATAETELANLSEIPYDESFAFYIVLSSQDVLSLFNGYTADVISNTYYIPFDKLEREEILAKLDAASVNYALHEGDSSAYRALVIAKE